MYIYASNDHISAITGKIDTDNHRHLMLQISISFHNEFNVLVNEELLICKGIIIRSNTNHTFYGDKYMQSFFLIDNTSTIAKQLNRQYLEKQPYYVIDDKSIIIIQTLLQQNYPILDRVQYLDFYKRLLHILNICQYSDTIIDKRIINMLSQIQSCTNAEHSLERMAKSVFLSQSRLSYLFKSETDMRLSSYIVLHKLQKAMFYIFSGKSITEAANIAGFDSSSHFASVVKKTLGMSARELNKNSVFLKVTTF